MASASARAHDPGLAGLSREGYSLSRSLWRLDGGTLKGTVEIPRELALHLLSGPAAADPATVDGAALEGAVTARIDVRVGDRSCAGTLEPSEPAGPRTLKLQLRYDCPGGGPIRVSMPFLQHYGPKHRHLANVDDGSGSRTEVMQGASSLEVQAGEGRWLPLSFLKMGIEHILGGYDHLVFLFGLILLGGRWRSLLGTVTAFTVAHSITLAVAALDVWTPGSAFVEPAIGLTIAYVGIENLFLRQPAGRWKIAFVLGLVHGFGFAGALAEAGIARQHVVPALLLFNVGVEVGQVLVLAVALPLVLRARRSEWVVHRGVPALSVGVALTGLALFAMRLWLLTFPLS